MVVFANGFATPRRITVMEHWEDKREKKEGSSDYAFTNPLAKRYLVNAGKDVGNLNRKTR